MAEIATTGDKNPGVYIDHRYILGSGTDEYRRRYDLIDWSVDLPALEEEVALRG